MSFLSNAHTHTTYCDGKSTVRETIEAARQLGFVSLGFSGHAWQGFDPDYCMSLAAQQAYLAELRAVQDEETSMRIYAGVEQDTLASAELKRRNRYAFDYIIGSAHYLPFLIDGVRPAVDGDLALLRRVVSECYEGDANELAQAYYGLHASGVEQDRPDIIGHFDLVRKYAAAIGLDTSHPRYRQIALAALERVRTTGAVLEVNTGAIARGYLQTPYPEPFLLEAWQDLGGEVTLTSDCHQADQLDCAFAQTEQTLRKLGFKRLLRLGTGAAFWEESPL